MNTELTVKTIGISRHRIGIDGSGVTTLVALHNCPLRCKYCLNPRALRENGILKEYTPEQLYEDVKKDYLYFIATGGGITFGGGEPLYSAASFFINFHHICCANGMKWKINIETSLHVDKRIVEKLSIYFDHWIIDIKDMNPDIYKAYTGKDNTQVISNLKFLIQIGANITVRVPHIPNYNTTDDMAHSVALLQEMGIKDIDQFDYIIKNK